MDLSARPLPSLDLLDAPTASAQVPLRALLESHELQPLEPRLSLALGRTVEGAVHTAHLSPMPHLLIGGGPLTGKRTFLKALLTTLLLRCRPADLRLLLVDSTGETLRAFGGLPHLIAPILTEDFHPIHALMWAEAEMERRYEQLAAAGVRNIDQYNGRLATMPRGVAEPHSGTRLPHVVVVFTELAPLMTYAQRAAERCLFNLNWCSRAAGIQVLIVTEDLSPHVLSGVVSVCVQARVCFKVSRPCEARAMMFRRGAESLAPCGDAFFLPSGSLTPVRLRTPFVSDDEVARVTDYWRAPHP